MDRNLTVFDEVATGQLTLSFCKSTANWNRNTEDCLQVPATGHDHTEERTFSEFKYVTN